MTFVRERSAIAFVARTVARFLEREALAKTLACGVPIDLPPVGIITMRNRMRTPASEQLIDCLRRAAKADRGQLTGTLPPSGRPPSFTR